jgi:hypothetical protein
MATASESDVDRAGTDTADRIVEDTWYRVEDCIPLQLEPLIYIKILSTRRGKIKLGIIAPKDVPVSRGGVSSESPDPSTGGR